MRFCSINDLKATVQNVMLILMSLLELHCADLTICSVPRWKHFSLLETESNKAPLCCLNLKISPQIQVAIRYQRITATHASTPWSRIKLLRITWLRRQFSGYVQLRFLFNTISTEYSERTAKWTYIKSLLSFLLRSLPQRPALVNKGFIPEINFIVIKNATADMTKFKINGYIIL